MNVQLSIIVPAYNVQDYLNDCINSILDQHFEEDQVEVLIIDDGSSDATSKMADDWVQKISYIRVVHQSNQGLAMARNTGIKEAHGEYLLFLDSDDRLVKDTIKGLLQIVKENHLDVLRYQYALVEDGKVKVPSRLLDGPRLTILSGSQFLASQRQIRCFAWLYIVSRAMLVNDSSLRFVPNLLYEDVEWTPRMLSCAQRMMVADTVAYLYIQRQNSITHSYSKQKVRRMLDSHKEVVKRLMEQRMRQSESWYNKIIFGMCESALTLAGKYNYDERAEVFEWVQSTLKNIPTQRMYATLIERVKYIMIRCSPKIYCFLRHIL